MTAQPRRNMFFHRMQELGYEDVTEFVRRKHDLDLSFETVRRAIHDDRQTLRYDIVVRLMQALEYTPREIAQELKRRGDTHLYKLVQTEHTGKGIELDPTEEHLIMGFRAMKVERPEFYRSLVTCFKIAFEDQKELQSYRAKKAQ